MRVQGRGEAARRQSAVVARTGFFELLATVAGRILQDTGINSGQCNKANNVNEQESLKENLPSEIDSQVSSVGSVTNHVVIDKRQSASVAFHLVAPSQLGMNEEEVQLRVAGKTEVVAGQTQNCFQSSEAAVWSPSQEEQSNVVVKEVTPVDEDSAAAPVNITSSPPADQVVYHCSLHFQVLLILLLEKNLADSGGIASQCNVTITIGHARLCCTNAYNRCICR